MTTLRSALEGKRFGLVLSAGFFGFYGHAGFLSGLQEAGLEPAAFAGSSAGGLVGAMAAAGAPASRVIELLRELKRESFWDPDVWGALWGAARGRHHSSGLLRGARFQALLEQHLPVRTIEACPKPVLLSVTNLTRGELEVLDSGELAPRIVATCAYPGLFRAVELGGQLYWDGGLVDKAPLLPLAERARALGLEALLVHYLPSQIRERLGGPFAYAHGLDIGMAISRREHFRLQLRAVAALGLPCHVVVSELPRVSPTKMHKGPEAIEAGRRAARAALERAPEPFGQAR